MSRNDNLPRNRKEYMEAQKSMPGPAYSGHQKLALNPRKTEFPISMNDWFFSLLLTIIPILNILFLLKWSFGSGVKASKRNFARAALLILLILINLIALAFVILYFVMDINIINEIKLLFV